MEKGQQGIMKGICDHSLRKIKAVSNVNKQEVFGFVLFFLKSENIKTLQESPKDNITNIHVFQN